MRHQLVIAIKSVYVANWFANTLLDYSRKNNVKIYLRFKGDVNYSKRNKITDTGDYNKKTSLWGKTNLANYFKIAENVDAIPILTFVKNNFEKGTSRKKILSNWYFINGGWQFMTPGITGKIYFILYFFASGRPMVISNGGDMEKNCAFFQVRSFKSSKNVGFLRCNLEKVLDYMLFKKQHGFPSCSETYSSGKFFIKALAFPIWATLQKISGKIKKP
ncbi:MAG: hypothetical protein ACOC2M_03440 [bacterium]